MDIVFFFFCIPILQYNPYTAFQSVAANNTSNSSLLAGKHLYKARDCAIQLGVLV